MAFNLPKLSLPKLKVPKLKVAKPAAPPLAQDKKRLPLIVGGIAVVAAGAWFGWQYFTEEPPPPPPPAKPAAPAPKKLTPAELEQARDKLINEVLAATGLKEQLEQLPTRLAEGLKSAEQSTKKRGNARTAMIQAELSAAFAAQDFQSRAAADLKKNFDEKRMQAVLKDYSSALGKSMIALERTGHAADEIAKFAQASAVKPPAAERTALVERIDKATRASDLAVEIAMTSLQALAAGEGGDNARKSAAMEKAIEKQGAAVEKKIRDATLLNLAFGFKDASDADLGKYAALYESEHSKWLYAQIYASLLEQAKLAATEAGAAIAKASSAPARAARSAPGGKHGADARRCLDLATNSAVIKCAEDYR